MKPGITNLILDVDGVIVGGRPGENFPVPHPDVCSAIQEIHQDGVTISFCTAKPAFAIRNLVYQLGLDTLHISNGGAEIVHHHDQNVIQAHYISRSVALDLVKEAAIIGLYTELYSLEEYALKSEHVNDLTRTNIEILQHKPVVIESHQKFVTQNDLTKIMFAAFNKEDKENITNLVGQYPELGLQWGSHPMYAPTLFAVVTVGGVSKQTGAEQLVSFKKTNFESTLGVGDGSSDWDFMQLCGHIGTLENASDDLKHKVSQRPNHIVAGSVDTNGVLDIFKHFELI